MTMDKQKFDQLEKISDEFIVGKMGQSAKALLKMLSLPKKVIVLAYLLNLPSENPEILELFNALKRVLEN